MHPPGTTPQSQRQNQPRDSSSIRQNPPRMMVPSLNKMHATMQRPPLTRAGPSNFAVRSAASHTAGTNLRNIYPEFFLIFEPASSNSTNKNMHECAIMIRSMYLLNIEINTIILTGTPVHRSDRLIAHHSLHTGVKSFKCLTCKKGFSRKDCMHAHCKKNNHQPASCES